MSTRSLGWAAGIVLLVQILAQSVFAQKAPQPAPQPAPPPASNWDKLPRMQTERLFAGPLQDTIIQRWRDPVDGTVCYFYMPITVQHAAQPEANGYVRYDGNVIGSISCFPATVPPGHAAAPGRK